jgi:hypothetical protein
MREEKQGSMGVGIMVWCSAWFAAAAAEAEGRRSRYAAAATVAEGRSTHYLILARQRKGIWREA